MSKRTFYIYNTLCWIHTGLYGIEEEYPDGRPQRESVEFKV